MNTQQALAKIQRTQAAHTAALQELLKAANIEIDLEVMQIMDAAELQTHLEEKIAEDAAAVEAVATRVQEAQAALEAAVAAAGASGVNVEALDSALANVKEHADAIDAAKTE
jgi:hypothetical protein